MLHRTIRSYFWGSESMRLGTTGPQAYWSFRNTVWAWLVKRLCSFKFYCGRHLLFVRRPFGVFFVGSSLYFWQGVGMEVARQQCLFRLWAIQVVGTAKDRPCSPSSSNAVEKRVSRVSWGMNSRSMEWSYYNSTQVKWRYGQNTGTHRTTPIHTSIHT